MFLPVDIPANSLVPRSNTVYIRTILISNRIPDLLQNSYHIAYFRITQNSDIEHNRPNRMHYVLPSIPVQIHSQDTMSKCSNSNRNGASARFIDAKTQLLDNWQRLSYLTQLGWITNQWSMIYIKLRWRIHLFRHSSKYNRAHLQHSVHISPDYEWACVPHFDEAVETDYSFIYGLESERKWKLRTIWCFGILEMESVKRPFLSANLQIYRPFSRFDASYI